MTMRGLVIVTMMAVAVISASPIQEKRDTQPIPEVAQVSLLRQLDDDIRIRQRAGESPMPDQLGMRVALGNEVVLLRLQRVRFPAVFLVDDAGVTEAFGLDKYNTAVYVDPSRQATFIVSKTAEGQYILNGSLVHHGRTLQLQPDPDNDLQDRVKRSAGDPEGQRTYAVSSLNLGDAIDDVTVSNGSLNGSLQDRLDTFQSGEDPTPERKNKRETNVLRQVVETAFIVDYSDYIQWLGQHNKEALPRLREFYTYVALTLNNIFTSVVEQDSSIDIKIAVTAYYVITSIDAAIVESPELDVDVLHYLNAVSRWVGNRTFLAGHDHYMAFTMNNLHTGSIHPEGVARLGGLCTTLSSGAPYSTTVVSTAFRHRTPLAAAHEMGHTLGANHDGEATSSTCASNQYFIMTPMAVNPVPARVDPRNPYTFSKCSLEAFKRNYKYSTCTHLNATSSSAYLALPFSSHSAFSFLSIRDQCRLYNPNGDFCPFYASLSNMCRRGVVCLSNKSFLFPCSSIMPLEGTPCYDTDNVTDNVADNVADKVCWKSQCVDRSLTVNTAPYFDVIVPPSNVTVKSSPPTTPTTTTTTGRPVKILVVPQRPALLSWPTRQTPPPPRTSEPTTTTKTTTAAGTSLSPSTTSTTTAKKHS